MSAPLLQVASLGLAPPQALAVAGERSARLRAIAAIALLAALGVLTASSLIASGDEWSLARARGYAPPAATTTPAAHSGPIDPQC